jgi:cytochrome c-type biogenesis protein CcmH
MTARRLALILAVTLASLGAGARAYAVLPDEMLKDPALEHRARELSAELRCLVCQNQSIDDSNADLAHDLRVLVRERLKAGDTNEQVLDYIVARYGEFVLLKPRFDLKNLVLWGTPVVLLLLGGGFMLVSARRRKLAPPKELTADEERALEGILEQGGPKGGNPSRT